MSEFKEAVRNIFQKDREPSQMETFMQTKEDLKVALTGSQVYVSRESTSFVSGDSPFTLDLDMQMGREGTEGFITNDGAGDLFVSLKLMNHKRFGDKFRLKATETLDISRLNISAIKLIHSGSDSSWRLLVA